MNQFETDESGFDQLLDEHPLITWLVLTLAAFGLFCVGTLIVLDVFNLGSKP